MNHGASIRNPNKILKTCRSLWQVDVSTQHFKQFQCDFKNHFASCRLHWSQLERGKKKIEPSTVHSPMQSFLLHLALTCISGLRIISQRVALSSSGNNFGVASKNGHLLIFLWSLLLAMSTHLNSTKLHRNNASTWIAQDRLDCSNSVRVSIFPFAMLTVFVVACSVFKNPRRLLSQLPMAWT